MDHMVPYDDHLAVLGGVETARGTPSGTAVESDPQTPAHARASRRPAPVASYEIEALHCAAKQTEWLEAIELLGAAVEPDAELHRLLPVWSACVGAGPAARGRQDTVEVLD